VADFIELSALWWSIGTVRDLDLIDWTIQEAEHLKTEGREVSDPDGTTSLDRLLAVLEREPVEQASPKDPVAQIVNAPSIQLTAEGPAEPTSPEVVTPPEPDIVLPAPTPLAPTADGWVDAQMSNLSLSETSSGWRLTENRAMLLFNEGTFQAHWLDGCRSISVAGNAQGRNLDIAAAN
jgi:hypothetical protein